MRRTRTSATPSDTQRINVMLSRARGLNIVVGAFHDFANSGVDFWETICRTTDELGRRVPAGDLA